MMLTTYVLVIIFVALLSVVVALKARKTTPPAYPPESTAEARIRHEAAQIHRSSANIQHILENFTLEVHK